MKKRMRRGESLVLDIDALAFGARGIARSDDFVWFVERGIPGQKVKARVVQVKRSYGEAYVEEIIEPSPHQVDPPCRYFGTCGGCQLQHLSYDVQIKEKTRQIQDIFERIGGMKDAEVYPTIPAEQIYGYRNKMEFSFSDSRWIVDGESTDKPRDFALGLHVPRRFDKVLDIDGCLLQGDLCNRVLKTVKDLVTQTDLKPYSIRNHTGFYRFIVFREGKHTDDLMLNFVTSSQAPNAGEDELKWIVHKLSWKHPEVTTILQSITDRKAQVALTDSQRLILGPEKITEKICGLNFEISPTAFFQTNTFQAERLFETIVELADFKGDEIVYDLYCGTGAIGIVVANAVKRVIGIEVIESAVEDARSNAELNRLFNIEFVLDDMKDALTHLDSLIHLYGAPDVVILDPPRGGTHPKSVNDILKLSPPKIIYVSCNPAILARDLQILCQTEYTLTVVQPVDMFPHTGHIEVVAVLEHI